MVKVERHWFPVDLCSIRYGQADEDRMPDDTFDVLLQGSPFCDLTFTFTDRDSLPEMGQEVFAQNFALNPGGVYNITSALTRLGLSAGLMAELGNDIFSRFVAERMETSGISLDLIRWVDRPLPVVTAGISFPRDRMFISYMPPELRAVPRLTIRELDRYRPRAFFSYGEFPAELYREARRRGILVFVDTHWSPEYLRSEGLRMVLRDVDVFSPNLNEALHMTRSESDEEALDILARWCECVVIKTGKDGCLASREGRRYTVPAIDVEAVDTTGAGDNFNAGLIYGLLRGQSFETCLRIANIAGGLSTLVLGGCGSILSETEVGNRLAEYAEQVGEVR
jgi:sugar/nucleoside kinase (ribokinase family)